RARRGHVFGHARRLSRTALRSDGGSGRAKRERVADASPGASRERRFATRGSPTRIARDARSAGATIAKEPGSRRARRIPGAGVSHGYVAGREALVQRGTRTACDPRPLRTQRVRRIVLAGAATR